MRLYFFEVTLRVEHEGRPTDTVLYKSARAASEHLARRSLLGLLLGEGFQVVRLNYVEERTRRD